MTLTADSGLATDVEASNRGVLVRVRGLCHRYGMDDAKRPTLEGIDFDLHPGEVVVLSGPSGAGKTTLLTLLGALREVTEGSVVIFGKELFGQTHREMEAVRQQIGFIFQHHNLFEALTAIQNVELALQLSRLGALERRTRAQKALAALGLEHRLHYKPGALSGGQRQRVAIARAIVHNPRLILADEPTADLDIDAAREVIKLLQHRVKQQGAAMLLVTHDHRVLDVADRIVRLVDGRIASNINVAEAAERWSALVRFTRFAQLPTWTLIDLASRMTTKRWQAGERLPITGGR